MKDFRVVPGLANFAVNRIGVMLNIRRMKMKRFEIAHNGYLRVSLSGKKFAVHRLVALVFIGPRPEGLQVNHKDGNKQNNDVSNLEYITPSANTLHSRRVLGQCTKNKHHKSKLTENIVAEIRERYKRGNISQQGLADIYGVTQANIWYVLKGKTWLV